ncbi:MAG: HD domain-containing protein, partial [Candidatus Cloacimonetes bacterium]|nr:HD domain-containing protein [Candidatus Cloacimonadota bacterium]
MGDTGIQDLMNNVLRYIKNKDEINLISRAYLCALELHKGQKRESGEEYIVHPVAVAFILSNMYADANTITAALLHDTVEDTNLTIQNIAEIFNPTVANLVDGVTKISKMNFSSKEEAKASNTRKIITSITNDVRIIIIKLADRLHNMRTLEYKTEFKQKENA